MAESFRFRRSLRQRIRDERVDVDVAGDVNVVISTGGGSAHSTQQAPIRQGRRARTPDQRHNPKETP